VLVAGCNLGQKPILYEAPGGLLGTSLQEPVDVDGDGRGDLITRTTVLYGDGTGFRLGPLDVPEGFPMNRRSALADLDGDDHVDLIGLGDMGLFVSLGDGTGHFGDATQVGTSDGLLFDIAVGDVNGDGHPDLVDVHGLNGGDVRLGDGTGAFGEPMPLGVPPFFIGQGSVIEDLDGDGDADLAVAAVGPAVGEGALAVFLGDGTGAFAPPTLHPAARTSPCGLAIGDVDSDGDLDAVTSGSAGGAVLLGDGAGGFGPATAVPSVGSCAAALGDIDGDGRLDLVAAPPSKPVAVQFGDGTGAFGDAHALTTGRPVVHDLDDDAQPDVILVGDDAVRVFMNRLDGRPTH
jgi:hypothetical protein